MTIRLPFASLLAALLLAALATPASAAPKLSNRTMMTYDPGHGTQVEYFDGSGRNYLWYPGNTGVVPGRWKLEGGNLCFRYGANTYNPQTNQSGGNWECQPTDMLRVRHRRPGGRRRLRALERRDPVRPHARPDDDRDARQRRGRGRRGSVSLARRGELRTDPRPGDRKRLCDGPGGVGLFQGQLRKGRLRQGLRAFPHGRPRRRPRRRTKDLEERAATGNPRAIAALEAIGD